MNEIKDVQLEIKENHKSINLGFQNISFSSKNRKKDKETKEILKNVSGSFLSGRLTAIIGPSGAGKTSLLNILSGFKESGVTGLITTNGELKNKRNFRNKYSYIPQEIHLLPKLTVLETLEVAADLKLSDKLVSKNNKLKIINNVVEMLKLQKCVDTYVEKLSGGEKKRLSIATELLRNPPIMFFDEPTSGLDSLSSYQIISHLKTLASTGRTIVCVIHQPSSKLLELIDDIFVLSDGRCIYNGPLDYLVETFREFNFECPTFYNRADFVLEVASKERQGNYDGLIERFSSHSKEDDILLEENQTERQPMLSEHSNSDMYLQEYQLCSKKRYPISQFKQFLILMRRNFLCMIRDVEFVQIRIICHILVGALLGLVFYNIGDDAMKVQTNVSCLFFYILFIFFANTMPTVLSFPPEKSVFLHEHLNNYYSLLSYYFAKFVSDIPLQILGPTSFTTVAYFLTGQPVQVDRFFMLWTICILTAFISQAIGLIAGAAFPLQMATFLVPCTAIPMLIFAGFFIKYNELFTFLKPLTYLSYFRYAFEGAINAIYAFDRPNLDCSDKFCYFRTSEKILKTLAMEENYYGYDCLGLLVWIVFLQIVLYLILKIKLLKKK